MTRCDRLEEQFKEREYHRMQFTKSSFSSLTESGIDEGELKNAAGLLLRILIALR